VAVAMKEDLAKQIKKRPMLVCLWTFLFLAVAALLLMLMMMLRIHQDEAMLFQQKTSFYERHEALVRAVHVNYDSAKRFVTTFETDYLQKYSQSIAQMEHAKRRLAAIASFEQMPGVSHAIADASMIYDELLDIQVHAISLVLHGFEIPEAVMPSLMREYRLASGELRLSAQEKILQARSLLVQSKTMGLDDKLWFDFQEMAQTAQRYYSDAKLRLNQEFDTVFMIAMMLVLLMFVVIVFTVWIRLMEENKSHDPSLPTESPSLEM
jgi:hypothetical protein